MNLVHLLFGFDGRIARGRFWIGLLILAAVEIVAMLIFNVPLIPLEPSPLPIRLREFAIQAVALYPTAAVMVKRLHDRDYPGTHAAWFIGLVLIILATNLVGLTGNPNNPTVLDYGLALCALVIGLAFLVDLGFRRGTMGDNQYGRDPLLGTGG